MKSYLKVKIKSLAAEAAIIRTEERKIVGQTVRAPKAQAEDAVSALRNYRFGGTARWLRDHQVIAAEIDAVESEYRGLHHHRTVLIRREARGAQLAYAIMRGRPYATTEAANSKPVDPGHVASILSRFDGTKASVAEARVKAWLGALTVR